MVASIASSVFSNTDTTTRNAGGFRCAAARSCPSRCGQHSLHTANASSAVCLVASQRNTIRRRRLLHATPVTPHTQRYQVLPQNVTSHSPHVLPSCYVSHAGLRVLLESRRVNRAGAHVSVLRHLLRSLQLSVLTPTTSRNRRLRNAADQAM